jgi:intracellular septation protein
MRQFIEFIPIMFFVVVYFTTKDIYLATGVLMVGVCAQIGIEYFRDRKVSKQTQVVFAVVMLAGGATLILQDELFIKWKPTIVNWLFSVVLLTSQFFGKDNLLKKMLGEHLTLPDHVWRNLGFGWALGFFIAGGLNLVVAYGFSTDIWVTYKLVGGFGLTLVYMIITITYLVKGGYIEETDENVDKNVDKNTDKNVDKNTAESTE